MDEEILNDMMKKEEVKREDYIEIEIPYNLYQHLNSEQCNVQSMCRICLATENEYLYPLVTTKENQVLAHMFTAFTNIQLLSEDGLPSSICETCQTQVVQCYEFKIKCEKSDCMLKSILNGEFIAKEELPAHSMTVKTENADNNNFIENYNISKSQDSNRNIDDEDETEIDVQYLEDLNDSSSNSNYHPDIKQNTGRRKKRKKDIGEESDKLKTPKHGKKSRKEISFPCDVCSKVFPNVKSFHAHVNSKHPGEKSPHGCTQCKDSFNSEHDLKVHASLHTKGNTWKCNQCFKEFSAKSMLRRHILRHMESKRYSCEYCNKAFTELYALRRHARIHTGEQLEKKYACTMCDKRYASRGLLATHVRRHGGLRPCQCGACGKRFPSARLLASHRLVHSDRKPYACRYCDKRFRHESTRNTHHRTHTGEKPYVCSVCGKNFIQNSNLTLHMRTHTGERPYACSMCDRKFTSGSSLKSHERVHSGERPYSCNICGKKFTRKNLSAHMRNHTGERPFECSVCSKKFFNATRLREHQRVHTGEKPFDCPMCSLKFATKSQQLKHSKTHQSKKKRSESRRGLVIVQHIEPVITDRIMFDREHGELIKVNENVTDVDNQSKVLTHDIVQGPLEVSGELVLQDDNNIKTDLLVVDNSQNSNYQTDDNMSLNPSDVNIIDDGNYAGDVNLVTVNEGGVSISTSNLEGTTVKLYQLDQSLVQIHSSGGQVTISKITSKMTANF